MVLIPVPVEITTSYGGGTAQGPAAILKASRQVDLYDTSLGRIYEPGIHLLNEMPELKRLNREGRKLAVEIIRRGGEIGGSSRLLWQLARVNEICAEINEIVECLATGLLGEEKLVGVIGGDHSAAFGLIRACARKHTRLGILHFDAHCDLRVAYEGFEWSHASIMHNVVRKIPQVRRLVQVGIRDFCEEEFEIIKESRGHIITFFDDMLQRGKFEGKTWRKMCLEITSRLPRDVYLSFDIDGLNPSLCPHTGTPVPGGLSFEEAVYLIETVVRSGRKIVGFDISEVAPGPGGDEWDANVGARLLYKIIGLTIKSQSHVQ